MSRLLTYGVEDADPDPPSGTSGTLAIEETDPNSGVKHYEADAADSTESNHRALWSTGSETLPAGVNNRDYFLRFYFKESANPSSPVTLCEYGNLAEGFYGKLELQTDGTVKLIRNGSIEVGSASPELSNAYHYLELRVRLGTESGNGQIEARLDGEQFAVDNTANLGTGLTHDELRLGVCNSSGGTGETTLRWDDAALNDDQEEEDNSWPGALEANESPVAESIEATNVGGAIATLAGTVNPKGLPTNWWVEVTSETFLGEPDYAAATSYPATKDEDAGDGEEAVPVSIDIEGLEPETKYWFRFRAENEIGTNTAEFPGPNFETGPGPSETPVSTSFSADHEDEDPASEYGATSSLDGTLTAAAGYTGSQSLKAEVTEPDGYARGQATKEQTGWKIGEEVRWGGAIYLEPGFYAAKQGQIDILRWDNFEQDEAETERSGLVIFGANDNLRLVVIKENSGAFENEEGPTDQATLVDTGQKLKEGKWYWVEVRQVLWHEDALAVNEVWIDGEKVGESTHRNCVRSDLEVSRYRCGIAATNGDQTNDIAVRVDHVRAGPMPLLGPPIGPPEVTTSPATGITTTRATLNGTVNPNGLPTDYAFALWRDGELDPNLLLGEWLLDESSGTTAADANGSRAGEYVGDPTLGATALAPDSNSAVEFGSGEYVDYASFPDFSDAFTVALWVRVDAENGFRTIGASDAFRWQAVHHEGNLFHLDFAPVEDSTVRVDVALEQGSVNHVAVTYDGTTVRLYVDGVEQTSGNRSVPAISALRFARDGLSEIGGSDQLLGALDNAVVYNRALSESEVAQLAEGDTATPTYHPAGKEGDAGEGSEAVAVSEEVTGLKYKARYTFRLYATNAEGEAFGEALTFQAGHSLVAVTREYPPDRLAWHIDPPGGGPNRWASDEPDPANVIEDITLTSEMDGGFKDATGELPRDPRLEYADQAAYGDVVVYGPGVEPVWGGRFEKASEVSGDQERVKVECTGWQAALEDDNGVQVGFIDSELGKWGEPSTQRRLNLLKEGILLSATVSTGWHGTGEEQPGVVIDFSQLISQEEKDEAADVWYRSEGVDIGRVLYLYNRQTGNEGVANWDTLISLSNDDVFGSESDPGTDHDAQTTTSMQSVSATTEGRKYARIRSLWKGGGTSAFDAVDLWENPRVLSWLATQNLALQGTWPNVGYTAKQMLQLAVPEFTPLSATDESIEDDGFVIPQAWYANPGPMSEVVQDLTKYGLLRWFVYEDKLFQVRRPGTFGRTWIIRSGPSGLEEVGLDAQRLWRSLIVSYCVDPDTECLTKRGWLTHDQLTDEDELLAFDPDEKVTKWEQPKEIFVNENYLGDMIHIDGAQGQLGALTTPDHRWPIYNRPRNGSELNTKVVTSETLPEEGYLIRNALHGDLPEDPTHSDAFVRLIAWYVTEGSLGTDGNRISITQCPRTNPDDVASIRADLNEVGKPSPGSKGTPADRRVLKPNDALRVARKQQRMSCRALARAVGLHHSSLRNYESGKCVPKTDMQEKIAAALDVPVIEIWNGEEEVYCHRWPGLWFAEYQYEGRPSLFRISGEGVDAITEAAPGSEKVPTMEFLLSLTQSQLEMFLDTCIRGDGYQPEGKRIFYQSPGGRMDAYTVAAVLAGKCPSLHVGHKGPSDSHYGGAVDACALNENRLGTQLRHLKRKRIAYAGTVWCPVTESGHWVARRRGKVFITGNTDVDGTTRTAGPVGSGADVEDSRLEITDPNHPAVLADLTRRDVLNLGSISTQEPAVAAGARFLEEANLLNRSGKASLTGYVEGSKGIMHPASHVRAGDRVIVADSGDLSEREITSCSYSHSSRSASVSLDAPAESVSALLERYRAQLVSLGIS